MAGNVTGSEFLKSSFRRTFAAQVNAGFRLSKETTMMLAAATFGIAILTNRRYHLDTRMVLDFRINHGGLGNFFGRHLRNYGGGSDLVVFRNRITGNIRAQHCVVHADDINRMRHERRMYNWALLSATFYTRPQDVETVVDLSDVCREYTFAGQGYLNVYKRRMITVEKPAASSGKSNQSSWINSFFGGKREELDAAGESGNADSKFVMVESVHGKEKRTHVEGDPVFPPAFLSIKVKLRCVQDFSSWEGNAQHVQDEIRIEATKLVARYYLSAIKRKHLSPNAHPVLAEAQLHTGGATGKGVTLEDVLGSAEGLNYKEDMHAIAERVAKKHGGILFASCVTLSPTAAGAATVSEKKYGCATPTATVVS